ncbi:MAG: type II secretion system secretin GspD [Thioploca sp.]|nr:type II secretion system secretin GspD [Thioploca sp.]
MLFPLKILLYCLGILLLQAVLAEEVTLNFKRMDINQLIDLISEVTHKTFIVDPRVKGEITVISNQPMDSDQVYEVFLSILSVHGFTAIPTGNVIKIVPDNLAKSQNTPVLLDNETLAGDSIITQVVSMQHVSAAQLIPLLRPLIQQQGHLVAYPENNTLVISDQASNVQRLLKIIHRIDQVSDEEIEVITLEHASAAEVVRILTSLEQKTTVATGTASTSSTHISTLVADERTNSVFISGDQATRLRLRTLITHLDTPVKTVGNTQVIYLRYAQATDLANVLKGITDSIEKTKTKDTQTTNKEILKTNIQADESTNSLVITAIPTVMRNLKDVIQQLDVRRAQVLVEAIIAEVSNDIARELGVQWVVYGANNTSPLGISNFDNTNQKIIDLATTGYQFSQNQNINLPSLKAGAFLGLGHFNSSVLNFAVLLQALSTDTNTNVLSTPSLLTLDNQEAEIHVGQNVPFVTGQYTNTGTGVTGSITSPFQTIQREDVGIKLKVKPQINEGNAVKLEIEQEVSSIGRSNVATTDIVTNKRSIKTTVIVEDNNMVVLGGLINEDLQQTTQKVPVLGDLPLIGGLFRSQISNKVKRNLMVFLHPVIVRDAASENIISGDKYSYMRTKQLEQQTQGLPLLSEHEIPILPNLDDFLTVLPGDKLTPRATKPQLDKNNP